MQLWLDDKRNPQDHLIQREFGAVEGMVWVKTVDEAKEYIKQGNVDYISFDHDLSTPQTGYDLAKWIEEQAFLGVIAPIIWCIHSQNMVGRANIDRAMRNADKYWRKS